MSTTKQEQEKSVESCATHACNSDTAKAKAKEATIKQQDKPNEQNVEKPKGSCCGG